MPGPLDGIRVVDWTHAHQGAAGAMLLAEMGADVIHVEQRGRGDLMRGFSKVFGIPLLLAGGRQILFEDFNKNKRSLSLDLTKRAGQEVMYELVKKADVFVTNMRPRAVAKLGMDYPTLVKHNPTLIYGMATAFGEHGPEQDSPGLEVTALARSGCMLGFGEVGDPPVYAAIGDRIGGIFLMAGVLAALVARDRSGEGQYFSTSQLGGMINLQAGPVITAALTGRNMRAPRREEATNPLYNWYRCGDGRWIVMSLVVDAQSKWPLFCQAIDRPDLIHDPRFAEFDLRAENCRELVAILDEVFATRPCEEWEHRLRQAGDLLFSRVNTPVDLVDDPQVLANNYLVDFDHPVLGDIKLVGLPINFEKTPASIRRPAPEYGEHTEQILLEDLGLTWDQVQDLREQEVV